MSVVRWMCVVLIGSFMFLVVFDSVVLLILWRYWMMLNVCLMFCICCEFDLVEFVMI